MSYSLDVFEKTNLHKKLDVDINVYVEALNVYVQTVYFYLTHTETISHSRKAF